MNWFSRVNNIYNGFCIAAGIIFSTMIVGYFLQNSFLFFNHGLGAFVVALIWGGGILGGIVKFWTFATTDVETP